MKKFFVGLGLLGTLAVFTATHSGHEIPIYPSYYPQEIRIESIDPASAGRLLEQANIHAYVGDETIFAHAPSKTISHVESLDTYVVLTLNPASPLSADEASGCSLIQTVVGTLATAREHRFFFHPYPVTPFDGDYLDYFDLAEAANKHYSTGEVASTSLKGVKLRVEGDLAKRLLPRVGHQPPSEWDVTIEQINVGNLVAPSNIDLNGWLGPPALKQGWFHAYLLLAPLLSDGSVKQGAESTFQRLRTGEYRDATERLNLQRQLLTTLTSQCRRVVVGYTLRREYYNTEYTAGIENVAYDSQAGLNSPIFLRTVKLKDLPWNGWLRLGIKQRPVAAWNPFGGFTDDTGHLIWSALGDPALFPEPYNASWLLNRMGDVKSTPAR
jgi:hypothetical protein